MDSEHLRAFFESDLMDAWRRFRAVCGVEPYVSVSTVSLTPDAQAAVVYVTFTCGPVCGEGKYVWLLRGAGVADWRIGGSVPVVIS